MPGTRTAVLIEDDGDIRNLVQGILAPSGITVRPAETGTYGVIEVRDHSPNIVILDFGLPDISGLEVLGQIRSFSSVYILMLTGRVDLSQALIDAGANAVMTKPFRPRALRKCVEDALGIPSSSITGGIKVDVPDGNC